MSPTRSTTLAPVRGSFRSIVGAVVPAAAGLDARGWARLEAIVDEALATRSRGQRRQLMLFLRLLGFFSLLRFARPLTRAGDGRVRTLLRTLERSPLLALRRGVWGVRTLAYMGYYGQPAIQREIGYRAVPGGWSARSDADA